MTIITTNKMQPTCMNTYIALLYNGSKHCDLLQTEYLKLRGRHNYDHVFGCKAVLPIIMEASSEMVQLLLISTSSLYTVLLHVKKANYKEDTKCSHHLITKPRCQLSN